MSKLVLADRELHPHVRVSFKKTDFWQFSVILLYVTIAISALLPTAYWTADIPVGTVPVWLLSFVLLFTAPSVGYVFMRRDGRAVGILFLYNIFLIIYGFLRNSSEWFNFDLNSFICFFSVYFFFYLSKSYLASFRFVLFVFFLYSLGSLLVLLNVLRSGIGLDILINSNLVRFGTTTATGFDDAWKIMLAGRLASFGFVVAVCFKAKVRRFVLILSFSIVVFLCALSLSRSILIAVAAGIIFAMMFILARRKRKFFLSKKHVRFAFFLLLFIFLYFIFLYPRFPEPVNNITGIAGRILARGVSDSGPDTIGIRIAEARFVMRDLKWWEWLIGRGFGGTFDSSEIYTADTGIDPARFLGRGGAPFSHTGLLTLVLKGGLVMVVLCVYAFARFFLSFPRMKPDMVPVYGAVMAGLCSYLVAASFGGPVHYQTGMIPFAALFCCASILRRNTCPAGG